MCGVVKSHEGIIPTDGHDVAYDHHRQCIQVTTLHSTRHSVAICREGCTDVKFYLTSELSDDFLFFAAGSSPSSLKSSEALDGSTV